MANPYYIPPAQYGSGLQGLASQVSGLGQTLAQKRELDRRRMLEDEAAAETEQALNEFEQAYVSKDYDAINRLSIRYPQIGKNIMAAMGADDERKMNNIVDTGLKIISNPESFNQVIDDNPVFAEQMGGADQAKQRFANNPEQVIDQAYMILAMTGSDRYKSFREATKQDQVDLQYKDGIIFNPKTGETERATVQPEAKKPTLKEVSGGVKYFTDGSEQPIGEDEQVKNPVTGKRFTPQQAQAVLADAKEFQLKNGGFAVTLDSGLNTVDRMYSEGYDPTKAAWVDSAFGSGAVSNLLKSDEDQVFMGAVDEMINAIARRETGAAITEFERKDFFNRYMPRPGDSKKRLKQKRNSLERQLKSIAGQSGGVYEALKITGDDRQYTPTVEQQTEPEATKSTVVIQAHPQFGDVTEDDITTTMQATGMTREQVLNRLRGQ